MHISKSVRRIVAAARGGGGRILVSPSLIHLRRRDHQQRSRNWPDRRKKNGRQRRSGRPSIKLITNSGQAQYPITLSIEAKSCIETQSTAAVVSSAGEQSVDVTRNGRLRVVGAAEQTANVD